MSEEILIRQGAPTLAGIKTGSLFPCPCEDREALLDDIRQLNRRLSSKGLCLLPIRFLAGQALLYLYRPAELRRDLRDAQASELLRQAGIEARVVKLNAIAPLRNDEVLAALGAEKRLLVLEDCMGSGCVGQRLTAILAQQGRMPGRLILKNLGDTIPCHGSVPQLYEQMGLDAESVAAALKEACHEQ